MIIASNSGSLATKIKPEFSDRLHLRFTSVLRLNWNIGVQKSCSQIFGRRPLQWLLNAKKSFDI